MFNSVVRSITHKDQPAHWRAGAPVSPTPLLKGEDLPGRGFLVGSGNPADTQIFHLQILLYTMTGAFPTQA